MLLFLAGCSAGRGAPSVVPAPAPVGGFVFVERSSEPLIGFGTVSLQIAAEPGVDADDLKKFHEMFAAELAQQLRKQHLTLVGAKEYSDLTLKMQVYDLSYVDFFARISGLSLLRKARLNAEIVLVDNYRRKNLWRIRTSAESLRIEGAVAASTTTQILALSDTIAKAFRDAMY